jgi:hypothetical protein
VHYRVRVRRRRQDAHPLEGGRLLAEHDVAAAPLAVLIGESLARSQFPDQDPVGRRMHVGGGNGPWYTIVGVVGDVKQGLLADTQANAVYLTPTQAWFADDAMSLVVRTLDDRTALTMGASYDRKDALGFINLIGLPIKVRAALAHNQPA